MKGPATGPHEHRTDCDMPILALAARETALLAQATRLQNARFSVVVVGPDKKPRGGRWRAAMDRMLTRDELLRGIRQGGAGLAVVGGAASGGLVVIDFDPDKLGRSAKTLNLDGDFDARWRAAISSVIDPDTLPCQLTPSGGRHYYLRCPTAPRGQKLAGVPAWKVECSQILIGTPGAPHVAIETRAEGNYAVIPTEGSGRSWANLSLHDTPTVTQEVLDAVLEAARALNQVSEAATTATPKTPQRDGPVRYAGESYISAYNAAHTVEELLEAHGYEYSPCEHKWRCPGSTSGNAGVSVLPDGRCYSHHASDVLADGKAHDAYDLYTILEHGGDTKAARAAWLEVSQGPYTGSRCPRAKYVWASGRSQGQTVAAALCWSTALTTDLELGAPRLSDACRQGLELAERYNYTTELCSDRYLNLDTFKSDVLLLRAAMGTGKTEAVGRLLGLLAPNLSVIAVSHLVGLVADLSRRLQIENYNDIPKGYEHLAHRSAYCVNSLWRLLIGGRQILNVDVLFIDEVEQLLRRLTSREAFDHKRACLKVLKSLVRNAKYVILADAHMSSTTLRWLQRLRPTSTPHMVLSNYQPGVKRTVYKYAHRGDVRAIARDRLEKGMRVYYALNGLEQAQAVEGWITDLKDELPGLQVLLVCSTTMSDDKVKAFFADPTGESRQYDLIVASPSVSTGVSIEAGIIGAVCGEFSSLVGTPHDAVQMLARPREVPELHVRVGVRHELKIDDRDAILASFWVDPGDDGNMVDDSDDDAGLGGVERSYAELYLDVMVAKAHATNNYGRLFWDLIDEDGFEVCVGESAPDAKAIEQHGKEVVKARDIAAYLEAADLTNEEDAVLAAKPEHELTPDDQYARKRHRLKRAYRLPHQPTREEVLAVYAADEGGKLRRQLERLELAAANVEEVDKLMARQRGTLAPDKVRYDDQYAAYRHTAEFVGLDLKTWESTGARWDAEALRERWVEPLAATWSNYQLTVPGWPRLEYAQQDPVKAIGNVLRSAFGISQAAPRNQARRSYTLTSTPLEQRRYWLLRRARLGEDDSESYQREDWTEEQMRQVNTYIR